MNDGSPVEKIYTFYPSGNVEHSTKLLFLGKALLRIAEDDRANMRLPFLAKSMIADDGLTRITVLAVEDDNSRIEIHSEVPEGGELAGRLLRRRMLHFKVVLTLAEEPDNGGNSNDGTVGWPYQKDPTYVAVEPIPIMDKDEDKIYLHSLFELELKRGLTIEGLNGKKHIERLEPDWKAVRHGDEGRALSLEDAKNVIETHTEYKLVRKRLDSNGNEIQILSQEEVIRPELAGNLAGTEFNKLFRSSFNVTLGVREFDGYTYSNEQDTRGNYRWISTRPYRVVEPIEVQTSPYIETELGADGVRHPTGVEVRVDTLSDSNIYYDSIQEPQSATNIHPVGNINGASLRYAYGMVASPMPSFCDILSDFTSRLSDKVYIGDISKAAKRNNLVWLTRYNPDGTQERLYVDPKLFCVFLPYYVEAYNSEKIWLANRYLTAPGDWYAVDYAHSGYAADEITYHVFPSIADPLEPDDFHYSNLACNWLMHPFRNNSWSDGLADFFTTARVNHELSTNLDFVFNDLYVNASSVFCDAPSRAILCIREFFANTENPTSFPGNRKSWDIKFESTLYDGKYRQDVEHFEALETYDNVPVETSPPLSTSNCPNFITEKGDAVIACLGSAIYAVCDFPPVTASRLSCSKRWISAEAARTGVSPKLAGSTATQEADVIAKRAWPTFLDGDWEYTNIYSSGITVGYLGELRGQYAEVMENPAFPKRLIATWDSRDDKTQRAVNGESIYSDSDEDITTRLLPDGVVPMEEDDKTWREEDTPESHLVHCIYRALEAEGYDKHHPVCDMRLEVNLYDKYVEEV